MDQPVTSRDAARDELRLLLRKVVSRDAAALKAVYERTSAKLYGICLGLLRDEGDAQDVLQEVYVTVWNKAPSYDPARASPITWLATLARNRAIDQLRRRRAPAASLDAALEVADDQASSLDVLEQAEDAIRLHRCLDALEEKARTVIRAAFFEGATYPELAERDGIPLPTVKSWVRRGLRRLRKCLEQ
jgi:RNA polymerase sigma-70 factor (ECF subfamily)